MKGSTTPKRVGCVELLFLCRYEGLACSLLLDWYIGSQKLREILTQLCCIIPSSSGKTNASSRRSKKDYWRRCRGVYAKSQHTKYPSQSLSLALHYLPFASYFPLPHFTLAVLFALSLSPPSLFASFARLLLVCSCASLLVCRDGSR